MILFSTLYTFGQNPEEIAIFQNFFGLEKKAIVKKIMKLEKQQADSFWPLYNEYEEQRKNIGKRHIELIDDYAKNYFDLSDDKVDEMFKRYVKIDKDFNKLVIKYHSKVKKSVNTKIAAQFFQLENYFADLVNVQIAAEIPSIGELK